MILHTAQSFLCFGLAKRALEQQAQGFCRSKEVIQQNKKKGELKARNLNLCMCNIVVLYP